MDWVKECVFFKNSEEVKSCESPEMEKRMGCVIAFSPFLRFEPAVEMEKQARSVVPERWVPETELKVIGSSD